MPHTGPTATVLAAFGVSGEPVALDGGMEPAFLVGGIVLKHANSFEEVEWRSVLFTRLDKPGFRVPKPVATVDGGWIAEGWMASRYLEGHHDPPRWADLVTASRALHAALAAEPRPRFLSLLEHRWARAHRVAWGEGQVEPVGDKGRHLFCSSTASRLPFWTSVPGGLLSAMRRAF